METQYFIHDDVKYIVHPDSMTPDGVTVREILGLSDEQYAAAVQQWQETGAQQ